MDNRLVGWKLLRQAPMPIMQAMSRLLCSVPALVAVAVLLSLLGDARAAFPGQNGQIAFAGARVGDLEIYVMNGDGTSQRRLTGDPGADVDPAWSPDGTRIAFTSNRLGSDDIYIMDAQGGGLTRLTTNPANDVNPAWSPGGRNLVFASTRDGNGEIYVMNEDGTGQARLTSNVAPDAVPAWSPDGTRIAFTSGRDGNNEIYVMNVDGTGQTRLTADAGDDVSPNWSSDGSRIAFASNRDGNYEIYVMDARGGDLTRLTRNTSIDLDPAWSPDANLITFTSLRDGDAEIYSMNANGTGQTRLTTNPAPDTTPDWQAVPETRGPPTAVESTSFSGRWRVSVYRGALVVKGTVPGQAKLQLALRRGARVYLSKALDLPTGAFLRSFKTPGNLLPATYVLDVSATGSPTELAAQHVPVTLRAPPEGVVSRAWSSTAVLGPPLSHLPPRTSLTFVHFRFSALPKAGRAIVVSWRGPAKAKPRRKPRADLVVAWIGTMNGPPLPRGKWQAVLKAGGTVVKRLNFWIG
jgi:Tol biopolymer transport system component